MCTWASQLDHFILEEGGLVFLYITWMAGCVCMCECLAPGCIMGVRAKSSSGNIWVICWEMLGPALITAVNLTSTPTLLQTIFPIHENNIPRWLWYLCVQEHNNDFSLKIPWLFLPTYWTWFTYIPEPEHTFKGLVESMSPWARPVLAAKEGLTKF